MIRRAHAHAFRRDDAIDHLVDRPPIIGTLELEHRDLLERGRQQPEQRRMLVAQHRPVDAPEQRVELLGAGKRGHPDAVAPVASKHVHGS